MKRLCFIITIVITTTFVFLAHSETTVKVLSDISYRDIDEFRRISFHSNDKVEFSDDIDLSPHKLWNRVFDYKIITDGKISYLIINEKNFSDRMLMLYSKDFLVLYDNSDQLVFKGTSNISVEGIGFPDPTIQVSSELIEGNTVYSGSNLRTLESNKCWVENKPDYGIGEHFKFGINGIGFFFFNGYVSGKKSYLYEQNSRVKQIEVKLLENNVSKLFEIEDTPNPQLILFGTDYSGDVEVKIIDVYKGSKYTDTCVNGVILVHGLPPYLQGLK